MRSRLRSFFLLFLTAAAMNANAFTFQPMSARLDSAGAGSILTYRVSNDSDGPLAVRFSVLSRSIDREGTETNEDASRLFTVYPSRVLVEPRSSSAVKLQWKGRADLSSELAFRFVAENVSLESDGVASSSLKVKFRYVASVYVGQETFLPKLVCTVTGAKGESGGKGFRVEVANRGTKHVIAEAVILTIMNVGGKTVVLKSDQLESISGTNFLSGDNRRFFIPWGQAVPEKKYDARIDYQSEF
ncbi:MAG: hypothetical protein WCT14_18555 [Treponemataceae bacterium]